MKVEVGKIYELRLHDKKTIFGVMYAFERGKNKDVYSLMVYTKHGCFEFPVQKNTLDRWTEEGKLKEVSTEDALLQILKE